MPDFLPRGDLELQAWAKQAAEAIHPSPESFALTHEQAQELMEASLRFHETLELAHSPQTAGPMRTLEKNDARAVLRETARRLVRIARASPLVSPSRLMQLDITRPEQDLSKGAMKLRPLVRIRKVERRTVHIRLCDKAAPLRRGKARGAAGATVFRHVGSQPPPDVLQWSFYCNTGQTRVAVEFPPGLPAGTKVWLAARWFNSRFDPGPVSDRLSAYLGGMSSVVTG